MVAQFGEELAKSLPARPAIVVSDDQARLYLTMMSSRKLGQPDQYVFIESRSLVHREYLCYLADRYPAFGKELADKAKIPELLTDRQASHLLAGLAGRQIVYYLHPSFGGIRFEEVCMTPLRMGEVLHPRPTNLLENLELSLRAIVTNQVYWHRMEKGPLASLPELAKNSTDARRVADYYSQILDYWGTELQKTGFRRKSPELLVDAGAQFAAALRLNPNNLMARANEDYNAQLQGTSASAIRGGAAAAASQYYGRWDLALAEGGPADVPLLDIEIGRYLAQGGAFVQAATSFERCLELSPSSVAAELDLANCYVDLGLTDATFALIKDMRSRSAGDPLELAGVEALAYISKNDFAKADQLLTDTKSKYPSDAKLPGVMAQLYGEMGYRALRSDPANSVPGASALGDASVWFGKSLKALDESLRMNPAIAANPQEIDLVRLRRAEMERIITNRADKGPAVRRQN
jgi:tetratricopeptide (TPR) repeat protein